MERVAGSVAGGDRDGGGRVQPPRAGVERGGHGTRDSSAISPDTLNLDQRFLDRPGNQEIQLQLFYDEVTKFQRSARSNVVALQSNGRPSGTVSV